MTCAAIIEIIDLGIDRVLTSLARTEYVYALKFVSIFEFAHGSLSTILAGCSLLKKFDCILDAVHKLPGLLGHWCQENQSAKDSCPDQTLVNIEPYESWL